MTKWEKIMKEFTLRLPTEKGVEMRGGGEHIITIPIAPDGNTRATEYELLPLLYGLVLAKRPKLVVETGAGIGTATHVLEKACRIVGAELYCYETDPEMYNNLLKNFDYPCIYDLPAIGGTAIKQADFAFLDSSYESRIEELEDMKPGSIALVHDTAQNNELYEACLQYPCVTLPGPRGACIVWKGV